MCNKLVIVRGAGDIASGTIHRLYMSGFKVLALECENPSSIRRYVSFSEAIYDGSAVIENVECVRAYNIKEAVNLINNGKLCVIADPKGKAIEELKPYAVVDAILAKKNLGTRKNMAPVTVALGPEFCAGTDVDYVIETMRGHNLGRIITDGYAMPNTGVPGVIAGYGAERVIHSPKSGVLRNISKISDIVEKGQAIAFIENGNDVTEIYASLTGVLRGLIRDGYHVTAGFKIADIDPRKEERENCFTISDKARCIAGSVLEAVMRNKTA